jgi:hypothetical protein
MSEPLRVRRLTHEEGQRIQRIVRRGGGVTDTSHVRWRALVPKHGGVPKVNPPKGDPPKKPKKG